MRSEAPRPRGHSLLHDPPHRIQHPLRRIHAIQILRDFRAQKSARHRMVGVALNLRGSPIFDRDEHSASIGAIVRTRGMDNLLHDLFDYTVLSEGLAEVAQLDGRVSGPKAGFTESF
jgi:hypothetical protein